MQCALALILVIASIFLQGTICAITFRHGTNRLNLKPFLREYSQENGHDCGLQFSASETEMVDYSHVEQPFLLASPENKNMTIIKINKHWFDDKPAIFYTFLRCFRRFLIFPADVDAGYQASKFKNYIANLGPYLKLATPQNPYSLTFHNSFDLIIWTDELMSYVHSGWNKKGPGQLSANKYFDHVHNPMFDTFLGKMGHGSVLFFLTYKRADFKPTQPHTAAIRTYTVKRIWMACTYCGPGTPRFKDPKRPTDCLELATCASTLHGQEACAAYALHAFDDILQNGKKMTWAWIRQKISTLAGRQTGYKTAESPFDRSQPIRAEEAVKNFVASVLNGTIMEISTVSSITTTYPTIIYKPNYDSMCRHHTRSLATVYDVGSFPGYVFLTSDGVVKEGSSATFKIYSVPFATDAWIALLAMMGFTATVVAFMLWLERLLDEKRREENRFSAAAKLLISANYWVFEILVEQVDSPAPERSKFMIRFCSVIAGAWLMMGIILTNGYRGMLKSEFMGQPGFVTNWTNLEEMFQNNFTAFTSIRWEDCEDYRSVVADYKKRFPDAGHYGIMPMYCAVAHQVGNIDRTPNCQLQFHFGSSAAAALGPERQRLLDALASLHTVCAGGTGTHWLEALKTNLSQSQTMLLLPTSLTGHFRQLTNWLNHAVLPSQKPKHERRFAIQSAGTQSFLTHKETLCHSDGIGNRLGSVVSARIRMLMPSGLLEFWRKWEAIRFPEELLFGPTSFPNYDSRAEALKAISFANSDIHLPFSIWAFCLALSLAAWIGEAAVGYWKRNAVKEGNEFPHIF